MASPQKENGFSPISNELLEALARIRIAGEARQMLDIIFRKTYGWNKKSDIISTSQFMELTGLHTYAIHKARKKLLEMNLISITNKGNSKGLTYSIQKDYDKWISIPKKGYTQKRQGGYPKKGIEVSPIKVTKCNPKGAIQKKERNVKDNIQKTNTAAEPPSAQKYFYSTYEQKTGHKYIADFGKDGAIFKGLLKIVPEDELKTLIDRFFESADDFIVKAGFTTGIFKTQVNKLRTGVKPLSAGAKILINAKNWMDKTR